MCATNSSRFHPFVVVVVIVAIYNNGDKQIDESIYFSALLRSKPTTTTFGKILCQNIHVKYVSNMDRAL